MQDIRIWELRLQLELFQWEGKKKIDLLINVQFFKQGEIQALE